MPKQPDFNDFAAQTREILTIWMRDPQLQYTVDRLSDFHEAALRQAVADARIEELELLIMENFDLNADYMQWSQAVTAYMRARLAMLASQRDGERKA